MRILSGDIGGTKTRLALIDTEPRGFRIVSEATFRSRDYLSLDRILTEFLGSIPGEFGCAAFGIAGPVRDGRCEATNLPWIVDADALRCDFGLNRVHLINDLEATAWGLQALDEADLYLLHPGIPDPLGNRSVVAAGTGLGEAGMCRVGSHYRPFASEGGHTDFAPATESEFALSQYLARRYGHVSWERVVSGMGIVEIFEFLCAYRSRSIPSELRVAMTEGDPAAYISTAADAGDCTLCAETMDLFVHLYGREVGNHALKVMATGGVYIGGGIAPKILARLKGPAFLDGFFGKGRMEPLMRSMPVQVILNDRAALFGPAVLASVTADTPLTGVGD